MTTCRIAVSVQPKTRVSDVVSLPDGTLKVLVTAPPEDDKGTEAVRTLLAKALGLAKRDVVIESGHRSRRKLLEIALDADEVAARLVAR
jgi:uncharacterized protein YggU (UPF0235/DUF167 family)